MNKTENSIDFIYSPLFSEGVEFVLRNIRQVYSEKESKIYVWIDEDYILREQMVVISDKYQAKSIIAKDKYTWCSRLKPEESRPRLLEAIRRLQRTCEYSEAKWIMALEDDVLVRGRVVNFPSTGCATNPGGVASGGTLYDRKIIGDVLKSYSDEELLSYMNQSPYYFAGDQTMLRILTLNKISVSIFQDLADGIPPDQTDKPILHNIKTHYPPYWREYRQYLDGEIDYNPMTL